MSTLRYQRVLQLALVATCGVACLVPMGCVSSPRSASTAVVQGNPGRGGGPPPHAPAHGYRRKLRQDGVQLVFDSGLDVYVVVDLSDVFFRDGRYFRFTGGSWSVSASPRGGWTRLEVSELPRGLRDYSGGPAKAKPRGKSGK